MLASGTDETWQENNHLDFDRGVGAMFTRCLEDPVCAVMYWASSPPPATAIAGVGLDALALGTADLLAPWQQQEQASSRH